MGIGGGTFLEALSTVGWVITEGVRCSRESETPQKHQDEYVGRGEIKFRENAFSLSSI